MKLDSNSELVHLKVDGVMTNGGPCDGGACGRGPWAGSRWCGPRCVEYRARLGIAHCICRWPVRMDITRPETLVGINTAHDDVGAE